MVGGGNRTPASYRAPQTVLERLCCKLLFQAVVNTPRIAIDFGNTPSIEDISAEFVLASPRPWPSLKILFAPGFNVGDTYAEGDWFLRKGSLTDFLFVMLGQAPLFYRSYYRFMSRLRGLRYYLEQYIFTRYFTRQVRRHYDLDSTIYEMILGKELIYTCGFFDTDHTTLREAQQKKIDTIISRLNLPFGTVQILNLGCGWGALERAIVQKHPLANICGLSISRNQIAWAQAQSDVTLSMAQASRIEYRVEDYADHSRFNFYDAVSVVGMLEHVGLGGYGKFFSRIERFLKPGGTALIHTILAPISNAPSNRWIGKRIFVGGQIPSLAEITRAMESAALSVTDIYLHPPKHYRKTLECWLENLLANYVPFCRHLAAKGASPTEAERAFRTWHFYLSAVRNMFDPNTPHTHQIGHICLNKKR